MGKQKSPADVGPVLGQYVWTEDAFYGELTCMSVPAHGGGPLGHLHLARNKKYSEVRQATGLIRER